ncbi:hypothetical protein G3T20_20605 [Bordetella hinzii]|uniref:GNAT family N-acetyltransferase n=1 Tax=Bordetella hinzii TaxID=103855 RepID=UPI0013EFD991|nr:hypothetical protein [Bordetella hinzii]QII86871.1 hypothetical protein G3T20_20605 [Bordetella hinzii]
MTLDLACAEIRLATPEDAPELTALLHRAYASLGEMGLCFMAVDQSEAATLRRMARGECYLATAGYRLLGTILFAPPAMTHGSPWLDRPGVASLHQFAVEPALQRSGLGVKCQEVVSIEFESGDGYGAADALVRSMPVVVV